MRSVPGTTVGLPAKREHGWLSLVALDWLTDGRNEIPSIGALTLKDGAVALQTAPGVEATIGGKPFSSGVLKSDAEKGGPDRVEIGSRAFVIIKRGDRHALRVGDSNAEARKQFAGIERFPTSRAWRIEARWCRISTKRSTLHARSPRMQRVRCRRNRTNLI
jgi:hypothetical protein